MRAQQQIEFAGFEPCQYLGALASAFAAGEDRDTQTRGLGERDDGLVMLARQDFGRRHQGSLAPGFDGCRGGEQRHDGLARTDIALQQAAHPLARSQVAANFSQR